jgi:hypothetical protein
VIRLLETKKAMVLCNTISIRREQWVTNDGGQTQQSLLAESESVKGRFPQLGSFFLIFQLMEGANLESNQIWKEKRI